MSLPRTPLPSGIPLRKSRDRPVSHVRSLSQQSVVSNRLSVLGSPGLSPSQAKTSHVTKRDSYVDHVTSPVHHVTSPVHHVTSAAAATPSTPATTSPLSGSSHVTDSASHVTSNSDYVTSPVHHVTSPQPPHVISVHAVIRIKPSTAKSAIADFSNTSITVTCAPQKRTFLYDHIFGPQTTQSEIYAHFHKSVDQFVAGYNVTIMAYGQSGSGKSYTMGTESQPSHVSSPNPGNPYPESRESSRESDGIVQRASADVFRKLAEKYRLGDSGEGLSGSGDLGSGLSGSGLDGSREVTITASYVELYNEQLRDLLDPTPKPQPMVREDSSGHVIVTGVNHVTVTTLEELLGLLRSGSELRQKGSTALNSESSRSHAIFTLTLTQNGAASKFNFVDLAGSERLKNSEAKGERVKEGISINGGLAALGKVISQLSQGGNVLSNQGGQNHVTQKKHISYRDSKLTRLLQDSLGGKAVTYLLSCITCDDTFVSETLSTLSYTQRARAIQLTPEISQTEGVELEQVKREMEWWRARARELERSRDGRDSRDTPSRMSTRDSPSRMSPTRTSRDSPTRFSRNSRFSPSRESRDLSRDRIPGHRHTRTLSRESNFEIMSPDTFSPRAESVTDVSRDISRDELSGFVKSRDVFSGLAKSHDLSRDDGSSRLTNTTEMHSAIEDMIKQYDLRILGLEEALREETASHMMSRELLNESRDLLSESRASETAAIERIVELEDELAELKSRDQTESRAQSRAESRAESRGTSETSRDQSRISALENHLDKSRVQHRQTLDELKRLSRNYESVSRDLERSRKEVEKEKQLRYDVIAQMKRASVVESRDESGGGGRHRIASSLFASLPRIGSSDSRDFSDSRDLGEPFEEVLESREQPKGVEARDLEESEVEPPSPVPKSPLPASPRGSMIGSPSRNPSRLSRDFSRDPIVPSPSRDSKLSSPSRDSLRSSRDLGRFH
ncbi:Chromosome-associated kinesin KIF4A [Yarrowia sp. B02]|nr:Chromosome-associated kinesin KIF4A [Yarrowia sp. B02]